MKLTVSLFELGLRSSKLKCRYCEGDARLVAGTVIYPHRPDLADRNFYWCEPCDAYVGCHQGTVTPYGTLANQPLRTLRQMLHKQFDPHWKNHKNRSRHQTRNALYARLGEALGMTKAQCHIGSFDDAQCREALKVVRSWGEPRNTPLHDGDKNECSPNPGDHAPVRQGPPKG
jgi:hypothetical protein